MSKNLYAVVGAWEMDASRWDEQQRSLHEQIVPMVSQSPGFVAGYWMGDRTASKTYSTIILEDEEAAQRFKALVEGDSARENQERFGVRNASLTVVEVLAEARR